MVANILERQPSIVKAILAASLLALGSTIVAGIANYTYTQHKREQCTRLVETIDLGHSTILSFAGEDATAHRQLASELETVARELDGLELSDLTLHNYTREFANSYRYLAGKYHSIGDILSEVGQVKPDLAGKNAIEQHRKKLTNTAHNIQEKARSTDRLAEQVNRYCQSLRSN